MKRQPHTADIKPIGMPKKLSGLLSSFLCSMFDVYNPCSKTAPGYILRTLSALCMHAEMPSDLKQNPAP